MAARKATHQLTNLSITEGSLVDAGDNPEAHIKLFKHKHESGTPTPATSTTAPAPTMFAKLKDRLAKWMGGAPKTTNVIVAERKFREDFWNLRSAFMDSVYGILDLADPDELSTLTGKTVAEFAAASKVLVATMKRLDVDKAADFEAIIAEMTEALGEQDPLTKAAPGSPVRDIQRAVFAAAVAKLEAFEPPDDDGSTDPTTKESPVTKPAQPVNKTFEEIIAALPEGERATVAAKLAAGTPAPAPVVDANKALPTDTALEAMEKRLRAEMQKGLDDANKRADKAEQETTKLREEAEHAGFVAKARKYTGLDTEKTAKQLKAAYKRSKEEGDELASLLDAAHAQAAKGRTRLTTTKGSSAPGGPADDVAKDAENQLQRKADEIHKASLSTVNKLTPQQAYAQATVENPRLYEAILGGEAALDDVGEA